MTTDQLTPTTITDQPFPIDSETVQQSTSNQGTTATNSQTPGTISEKTFPTPVIAQETISQTIDTQSKRIKGSYQFDQLGAIQIGQYTNGVSGQIIISPNGIIATNFNNQITFTLDGTTGDATFLGTLQAGTLIAGDSNVVIGKGDSGGGRIVLFNDGVPVIVIGDPS